MAGFSPEVQQGLSLALEAERRGFITPEKLQELLEYWDKDGQLYPAPARDVLQRLGGVTPEQLRELLGLGPAGFQPRELTPRLLLLEPLGEGGMGTVYKAQDRVLRRVVAVKLIKRDRLASQQALQRFEREAMVMARVAHPACIPVYDANVVDGQPYLVMKFAPGASLRAELARHPRGVDPRRVARWGQRLAEGLQACHEVGVVHRDVKPGNVLLDEQDQPLLTDFGVALDGEAATKLTLGSNPVGTLAYMPPEQALGEPADPRSDVYSLGASLYEALTGELPFTTDQPLVLFRLIAEAPPRPLRALRPGLPEDLERVVLKCLEKRREDRYPTAQALALDLARWLAGEPVSARPLSWTSRAARFIWRRRRVAAATAMSLLALGIGLLSWSTVRRRAARSAALEAIETASLSSDRLASEEVLIRLSTDPDPVIAANGRAALVELRVANRLSEAESQFRRWEQLVERGASVRQRLRQLYGIDETIPIEESPLKQERLRLQREVARLPALQQEAVGLVERALAAAEGLGASAARVETQRAKLLIALAHYTVRVDPDFAELLYTRAAKANERGDGSLRSELEPAVVTIESRVAGEFRVWHYLTSESAGRPLPQLVGEGTLPARLQLNAGEFVVEVTGDRVLPVRDTLLLRRGETRTLLVDNPLRSALGPLVDDIVVVPAGPVRTSPSEPTAPRQLPHEVLFSRHELTVDAWRSRWLELGRPPELLPVGVPGDPAVFLMSSARALLAAPGLSARHADSWCDWFSDDLALAGLQWKARLPTMQEWLRAVRGEFGWIFPWGRQYDPSFCASHEAVRGNMTRIDSHPIDCSPFGIRGMAGGVAEPTCDVLYGERLVLGGSWADPAEFIQNSLLGGSAIPKDMSNVALGLRFVLEPLLSPQLPLPDPAVDWREVARSRARAGDWKVALPAARNSIALAPKDPQRWIERGKLRLQAGDTWGARFDLLQASILGVNTVDLWSTLAAVEYMRRDYEKTVEHCTQALLLDPNGWALYWNRSTALYMLGRWDAAVVDALRCVELARNPFQLARAHDALVQARGRQAVAAAAEVLRRN